MQRFTLPIVGALLLATPGLAQFSSAIGTDAGSGVATPDDGILGPLSLGFNFTFPDGTVANTIDIDTNCRILPGSSGAASDFDESPADLVAAPSSLCPYWDDMTPIGLSPAQRGRIYFFTDGVSTANVTFCNIKRFGTTTFDHNEWTIQCQINADGSFAFVYDERVFSTNSLIVGASAGNGAIDPGEINLSDGHTSGLGGDDTNLYENFSTSGEPFDLMGKSLTYTPAVGGGYDVSVGDAGITPCGGELFGASCPVSFHFIPDGSGGYSVLRGPLDFGDGSGIGFFDDGGVGAPNTIEWGVGLGDDNNAGPFVPSGFGGFKFPGQSFDAAEYWMDNNARIMPNNTDPGDFNASVSDFLDSSAPQIALFWGDMSAQRGSLRSYEDPAGNFISITWDKTPKFFESLTLTFQCVMRDDDSFSIHLKDVNDWATGSGFTSDHVLIGCSPGADSGGTPHPDPGEYDFTTGVMQGTGLPPAIGEPCIYEFWDSNTERPDVHTMLYPHEIDGASLIGRNWTEPRSGQPYTLTMEGVPSSSLSTTLLLQLGPTPGGYPIDLGALGPIFGPGLECCTLYVNPTINVPMTVDTTNGTAETTITISGDPSLVGLELHGQGANVEFGANPLNVVLSNVARGVIQP